MYIRKGILLQVAFFSKFQVRKLSYILYKPLAISFVVVLDYPVC